MSTWPGSDMLWNRDMVAAYLQEAAATMRSLPAVKVQGHFNVWPPVLQNFWEAYASTDELPRRGPATPQAIDRMDMVLPWLGWLEPGEAKLVWLRAEGVRWKAIQARYGVGRTTAWMRWTTALEKIAACLNRQR